MIRLNQTLMAGNSFILHLAPSACEAGIVFGPADPPLANAVERVVLNAPKGLGTYPGKEQKSVPYIRASSSQRL
jgi:hypothetical protein